MSIYPILMIPGIAGGKTSWKGMPEATIAQSELSTISEMAIDILNNAPDKFILVGHSMGGYISFKIMEMAQERVEKLVLISTSPFADTENQTKARNRIMDYARKDFGTIVKSLSSALLSTSGKNNPDLVSFFINMLEECGPERFLREQGAALTREDYNHILPNIKVPTLIISGLDDSIISHENSKIIAEKIPNSQLELIDGCGHIPQVEAFEQVKTIIEKFI